MWAIIKSDWVLFLKNLLGDIFGTIGTLFSVSGPTLTKKLLNELAISIESSTILPLIFKCEMVNLVDFLTLTIFLIPSHVF